MAFVNHARKLDCFIKIQYSFMPFTLAHPLLPVLVKKGFPRLSLTAMVAGSIMPDMENFFRMYEHGPGGHTVMGVLRFNVPVGLLLCFLYHSLIRNPLINNLPSVYRNRYISYQSYNWTRYALTNKGTVLFSLLTGIASHFAWDAFTHQDGTMVEVIPFLAKKVHMGGTAYPLFYLLQLLSSICGIWFLHRYILARPVKRNRQYNRAPDRYYWMTFLLLWIVLLIVRLYGWPELNSYLGVWRAGMGAWVYAWILVSLIFYQSSNRITPPHTSLLRS